MKHLFFKLLLLFGLVFAIVRSVDVVYRYYYELGPDALPPFRMNQPIEKPYQIVTVGNSHADSGITFEGYAIPSLRLAGVAQRFSFDLALLKQYRRQIAPQAVIIIPVTPISFSHRPADRNDGLQGNYYDRLVPWLIPDLKVDDYIQKKFLPSVRSGYLVRQRYAETVRERIAQEEKAPEPPKPTPTPVPTAAATTPTAELAAVPAAKPVATPVPVPVRVPRVSKEDWFFNLEAMNAELASPSTALATDYKDNINFIYHKWYETDEFGTEHFASNRADLEELIAYCLEQGWRPVLITIPVAQILQEGLLSDYMSTYLYSNLQQTNTQGVPYFDFSNRTELTTNPYLFGNADHLNERGAPIFSYMLLQTLIEHGYLSKEVDNYDYGPLYRDAQQT